MPTPSSARTVPVTRCPALLLIMLYSFVDASRAQLRCAERPDADATMSDTDQARCPVLRAARSAAGKSAIEPRAAPRPSRLLAARAGVEIPQDGQSAAT